MNTQGITHLGVVVDQRVTPTGEVRPLLHYWRLLLHRNEIDSKRLLELAELWLTHNHHVPHGMTLQAFAVETVAKLGVPAMTWEDFIIGLNIIDVRDFRFDFR